MEVTESFVEYIKTKPIVFEVFGHYQQHPLHLQGQDLNRYWSLAWHKGTWGSCSGYAVFVLLKLGTTALEAESLMEVKVLAEACLPSVVTDGIVLPCQTWKAVLPAHPRNPLVIGALHWEYWELQQ